MKRMQVLFEETEYRRIVRLAKRQGMTLAEWVRQTLRYAYQQEPLGDRDKKLAAVRTAATHEFPTADIDQMLAEIASGYGSTEEH
jgi:hypothetical protein